MSIISDKSSAYSIRIVRMCKYLRQYKVDKLDKEAQTMLDQVFRSGTSIGANTAESLFAQSRPDFVSKLSIALKEAKETQHWLDCLHIGCYLTDEQYKSMTSDVKEIISILVKSIKTTKKNGI